jgi:hypothetical protein
MSFEADGESGKKNMKARRIASWIGGFLFLAVLALGGYSLLHRTQPGICPLCRREIHRQASAVMETNGQRQRVCCVRCAVTLGRQTGQTVRLVEVTDFNTEKALHPEDAFYVEASPIVLCERHEPLVTQERQPYERIFDRCEPSAFAFARRQEAEAFISQHGGVLRTLDQLMKEEEPRP